MQYHNQLHGPRKKKQRVDNNGNDHHRLWIKDGHTTMLLTKDLTKQGCEVLIDTIVSSAKALGTIIPSNRFLITK